LTDRLVNRPCIESSGDYGAEIEACLDLLDRHACGPGKNHQRPSPPGQSKILVLVQGRPAKWAGAFVQGFSELLGGQEHEQDSA
jgi:hypothetical protein